MNGSRTTCRSEAFSNAAYGELYCVSRGRLGDKDAIELRAKFKTLDLASVAFYMIDESRVTFASPLTGLPLHTSITQNAFGLPKNHPEFSYGPDPTHGYSDDDLPASPIGRDGYSFHARRREGLQRRFQPGLAEKSKTDAGEFDTTVVGLQSDFFTERGMTNVRVNLTNDEAHLPVLIRFRTTKGNVRIGLASSRISNLKWSAQATPVPVRTPLPERTPKPAPTPTPYVNDQPLSSDLAFDLGEQLDYRITALGQQVAKMRLSVKERKQINGIDSLLLEATFLETRASSPFAAGDYIRAYVRPESLAPIQLEMKFSGAMRPYTTIAKFERDGSLINAGGKPIEAPVGTHSIISLLYAARWFNLKPSRDLNNPINDTRVAVLWESQPIFLLFDHPCRRC